MNVQIEESWKAHLEPEFEKDYFRTLTDFVKSEYSQYQIFPPGKHSSPCRSLPRRRSSFGATLLPDYRLP